MKPIIDVSEHNGVIDWESVKTQVDGAILRCGYGGNVVQQDDKQYIRNAQACTRLAIPFGVYLFSYARNAQEAMDEAKHVLRLVQGYDLQLPIYYDLEYSAYVGDLSSATYEEIAKAFCEQIEKANGFVGIYANTSYWETKLANVNAYTRWVAQWGSTVTLDKPFALWQYTSEGKIKGSSPRNDLSKWYHSFLTMVGNKNDFRSISNVEQKPEQPGHLRYQVQDVVSFKGLYISSTSTKLITNILVNKGTITKVLPNARNPYLIGNGIGWVNEQVIIDESKNTLLYQKNDHVSFDGLYNSSQSSEKITNIAVSSGTITKVLPDARNPYLIDNGIGWVNDTTILANTAIFRISDKVKVRAGAKDSNGTTLAPFVYDNIYQVMQVDQERIVIGDGKQITAAMHPKDLYHV